MKYHFFSCFDRNYAVIGLTLYRSLKALQLDFEFYVCALDRECYDIIACLAERGERLIPVDLAEVERFDPEFAGCRAGRSRAEYIFTMSPVLPGYLFHAFPGVDMFTYLDADLFFYRDPEEIFREFEAAHGNALIVEHGFPERLKWRERLFGRFNVEFQIYRRGGAEAILADWRSKCLEWCFDRADNGRFADQKYLDAWPEEFTGVVITGNSGAGVAPWNWPERDLNKMIFFHFQGFNFLSSHWASTNCGSYGNRHNKAIAQLYRGYAGELKESAGWLKSLLPGGQFSAVKREPRINSGKIRKIISAAVHHNLLYIP